MHEQGEPGDILVTHLVVLGAELADGRVETAGGPEHDGAPDQAAPS
ncbi:hypothetical protein [Streptomyces shaanxiensis]